MVSSSSRRARRGDKRKHKRQSRSRSQSSEDGESSAPVSRSEENNDGKLVNKDEGKMACSPRLAAALAAMPETEEDAPDDNDQHRICSSARRAWLADKRKPKLHSRSRSQSSEDGESSAPVSSMTPDDSDQQRIYESGTPEDLSWLVPDEALEQVNSVVLDSVEEFELYQRIFRKVEEVEAAARKAKSDNSIASSAEGEHGEMDHHYIGVRSRRAVDKMLNPGQFYLYYNKPSGVEIPVTVDLNIGYMSSTKKIYHFPIQRFECEGDSYYAVRQTDTDVKMFPSIASLVKHYHTFAHVDPEPDQLETFGLPPN